MYVASYSYQCTEYKHVAMPNRNYTIVCILYVNTAPINSPQHSQHPTGFMHLQLPLL